jgi:hypothetical protein
MRDVGPVLAGDVSVAEHSVGIGPEDLPTLVNALYDEVEKITAGASDRDVTFVPDDPEANDPPGEGWTFGHVIVHVTAGLEEAAALSSSLARGVEVTGRSRHETPWQTVTRADQVQQRLTETRRMVLAFLQTWPDEPDLDLTSTPVPRFGPMNAVARFVFGMIHGQGHLDQLRRIREQARPAGS